MSYRIQNISKHRQSAGDFLRRRLLNKAMLWRLIWLLLFAMHVPATIKVYAAATQVGEPTAWSSLVLLAATNIFFVLEIVFAWSLRVLSDRRCLIAFILIVAMMHAGVIERVIPQATVDQGLELLLFVSTVATVMLAYVIAMAARLIGVNALSDQGRFLARLRMRYHRAAFALARVPRFSPYRRACTRRAPPSHLS